MAEKLEKYNKKRDFNRTIEPKGIQSDKKSNKKLKFVVQHHWARREHYDLRLEWEGTLLSWAVPKGPSYNPEDKRLAVKVEDHPLEYRHFEGTIPKGEYGGGTVMLWDEGYWEYQYDVAEGLNKGSLKFTLYGKRLEGNWALVRLKSKDEKDNWLLIKEKDSYAKDHEGIFNFTQGVRSGLTKDEIEKGSNKDEIENGGSSVAAAEGNSFGDTKNKPTAPKKSKAASNTKSKPANNNKNKVSKNPFSEAEAQPALLVSQPPEGEGWIFEPKYDGYRILSFIENNTARLVTRNGNDFTPQFNVLAEELAAHAEGRAVVLDGEVVIADDSGKTDFQALQNYMKNPQGEQLTFAIFDILALDGEDLRGLPLSERKKVLESFMQDAPPNLYFSKELKGSGKQNFLSVCQLKLEGIIGKKLNSVYSGKRNGDWVKVKCANAQEFVVGGYTQTAKKTEGLSALLLGYYEGKELIFAGRAGTGFSEKQRRELAKQFEPIIIKNSPFSILPKIKIDEKVFWLQPQIVAEVQFAGWTDGNVLRQPSFKGIRADKNPLAVVREEEKKVMDNKKKTTTAKPKSSKSIKPKTTSTVELKTASTTDKTVKGIKVSSPDKVVFTNPSITKLDIVRYYGEVSERLLKYAGGRVLSIIRCPKGISEACFYKKHHGSPGKGVVIIPVKGSEGKESDYFYIDEAIGFVSEAQMGTLEFHTWASRADNLEKPDVMVFDLDPDEGMELERVRQGVKDLKDILDELSLTSFLKVTGGKGYHIIVPFEPSVGWDAFGAFAKQIAEVMASKFPDRYTTNMRKEKRKGKIFVDWVRNGRGATSVAPYSLRAREGARVAMPISWDELDTMPPDGITITEALARLNASDPWEQFANIKQRIKP